MPPPGRLIVFEGVEGAGKSTQLGLLAAHLRRAGVVVDDLREPGGTPAGNEIRRLLLDSSHDITFRAEALLFMASRAQLVEREIGPALASGRLVLLDRFLLSTYAYQSAGRGIPVEDIRAANALATAGLVPDLTVLLDLPDGEGMARAARRSEQDRMELSGHDFHARVAGAFRSFATPGWQRSHPECGPIVIVDGAGGERVVAQRITRELGKRWPETFPVIGGLE
ncbi:MAG: dTMP kinase [Gemmatimonadaceae bacterium]